jgi:hypothetical protein
MVSWPDSADTELAHHFWSTNPSLALLRTGDNGTSDRLVALFDDASGCFDYSPTLGGALSFSNKCNVAGVALSDDFGQSWRRPTRFLPGIGPSTSLIGGARVAATTTGLVATALGRRDDPNHLPPAGRANLLVAFTSRDGEHWSEPTILAELPTNAVMGAAALGTAGDVATVVWPTRNANGAIETWSSTSEDEGRTWSSPSRLVLAGEADGVASVSVSLVSGQFGYVAYAGDSTHGATNLRVDAIVGGTSSRSRSWTAEARYRAPLDFDPTVWVRPRSSESDPGRSFTDAAGFAFDIGNIDPVDGSASLYLVFRARDAENRSEVLFASCANSGALDRGCAASDAWDVHSMKPTFGETGGIGRLTPFYGQFQPTVAADHQNGDVFVSWYEDLGPMNNDAQTHRFTVHAKRSTGSVVAFGHAVGIGDAWAPCPSALFDSFGDHISAIIFPGDHAADSMPAMLTAYTTSTGGCQPQRAAWPMSVTFDQHVESFRWPQ